MDIHGSTSVSNKTMSRSSDGGEELKKKDDKSNQDNIKDSTSNPISNPIKGNKHLPVEKKVSIIDDKFQETTTELLGSVTTHTCPGTRTSARVIQKMKLDLTRPTTPPPILNERENKKDEKNVQKTPSQLRPHKTSWSNIERSHFFDGLNEFGKDFEAIGNYINAKLKRKSSTDISYKTKDQVRQHYYQTFHKICKYVRFSDEIKKLVQELYALINYGEMRRRLQFVTDKHFMKLKHLIYKGHITVRCKGKNVRVKTPSCRALRKLNQLDDSLEDIRLPSKIEVIISPANMESFGRVQSIAQNPRVRTTVPLHKKLINFIKTFETKWQVMPRLSLLTQNSNEQFDKSLATINENILPQYYQEENEICFLPKPNVIIHRPLLSITEYLSSFNLCLAAYEERMGIQVRSETLCMERLASSKRQRTESGSEKRSPDVKKLKTIIKDEEKSEDIHENPNDKDYLQNSMENSTNISAVPSAPASVQPQPQSTSSHQDLDNLIKSESSSDELNEEHHHHQNQQSDLDSSKEDPANSLIKSVKENQQNDNETMINSLTQSQIPASTTTQALTQTQQHVQLQFQSQQKQQSNEQQQSLNQNQNPNTISNPTSSSNPSSISTLTPASTPTPASASTSAATSNPPPNPSQQQRSKRSSQQLKPIRSSLNFKPLINDDNLKRIRKGWTISNAADITIGDLYVVLGQDSRLELDYYWKKVNNTPSSSSANPSSSSIQSTDTTETNVNLKQSHSRLPYNTIDCDDHVMVDKISHSTIGNKLKHLLLIANLSERIRKRHCFCGHVCERNTSKPKMEREYSIKPSIYNRNIPSSSTSSSNNDNILFRQPYPPIRRQMICPDPNKQLSTLSRPKMSRQVLIQRLLLPGSAGGNQAFDILDSSRLSYNILDNNNITERQLTKLEPEVTSISNNNNNNNNNTILEENISTQIKENVVSSNLKEMNSNSEEMNSNAEEVNLEELRTYQETGFLTSNETNVTSETREEENNCVTDVDSIPQSSTTNSNSNIEKCADSSSCLQTPNHLFVSSFDEGSSTTNSIFNGLFSPMQLFRDSSSNSRWIEENFNDFSLNSLLGHLDDMNPSREPLNLSSNISVISESSVDFRHKFQEISALMQNQDKDKALDD